MRCTGHEADCARLFPRIHTCSTLRCYQRARQQHRHRTQGLRDFFGSIGQPSTPQGDDHQPEFVTLDEGLSSVEGEAFGPMAVLLVGFLRKEFEQICSMMGAMEADMVKVIPCSRAMLKGSLQEAIESTPSPHEQLPQGTHRAVVVSGMYPSEVSEVIGAYREEGLPEPIFAVALPCNWDRQVRQLLEDVSGDHQHMMAREREVDAQRLAAERSFQLPAQQ